MSEVLRESILDSIKELIGPDQAYDAFDADLLIHINSCFSVLNQLGVGPAEGFRITGSNETWQDFLGDSKKLDDVKSYIYMKVKLIFDAPLSSAVIKVMEEQIKELEWRMNVTVDPGE